MDKLQAVRAYRPGMLQERKSRVVAFRSPQDQPEIDRRVEIYASQIAANGFITWLPKRSSGD